MDISADHDSISNPDSEELDTTQLTLTRLRSNNLVAKWGHGNSVSLFNIAKRTDKPNFEKKTSAQRDSTVLAFSWDNILIARQLVCESHAVFYNTQELRRNSERRISDLLSASQQYRASLKSLSSSADHFVLQDMVATRELGTYEVIEMMWHVGETMLFTRSPVLPGLLNWVATHFAPHLADSFRSKCEEAAETEDKSTSLVHEDPEYWSSICAYLVRGMTKPAIQLLKLHPLFHATANPSENGFAILKHLIKKMPMIYREAEEVDFQSQWTSWKAEVEAASRRSDIFVNRPAQLSTVFSLLAGDATTICNHSNNWAITLVGLVLYAHPTSKPHEIRPLLQQLQSLIATRAASDTQQAEVTKFYANIGNLDDTVDALVQAIFGLETEMILHGVLDFGNPWFSAHFLDLFSLCDITPFEFLDANACSYHEFAFLEYVSSLMTDRLPIRILADYLTCCPTYGRDYMVQLIAHQPIYTEKDACKLLALCHSFKLTNTHASQYITQAVVSQRARTGRLASALTWATGTQALQLADTLLTSVYKPLASLDAELCKTLKMSPTTQLTSDQDDGVTVTSHSRKASLIVAALAPSSLDTEDAPVQFLKLYAQILQAFAEGDLQETLVLLGRSIGSGLAPKRFWLDILFDCTAIIGLIRSKNPSSGPVFSSSEIYDLMHCLEEAETLKAHPTTITDHIRLTLSHQLSQAILSGL
jgi:nuclear pore complex protein Nup85